MIIPVKFPILEDPQIQMIFVIAGVLCIEAGVWGLASKILPTERRYIALREQGDYMIDLIRKLNAAALAGGKKDQLFRNTLEQMHVSVDRMAELSGQDTTLETSSTAPPGHASEDT